MTRRALMSLLRPSHLRQYHPNRSSMSCHFQHVILRIYLLISAGLIMELRDSIDEYMSATTMVEHHIPSLPELFPGNSRTWL